MKKMISIIFIMAILGSFGMASRNAEACGGCCPVSGEKTGQVEPAD